MNITSKIEFNQISAVLCGSMVSVNGETRVRAAEEAQILLAKLPKFLRNSPHCKGEIEALSTLINRVQS